MATTKKISKREALGLLKDYFRFSERSRKIGNMEIELELTYQEKVGEQNQCYYNILEIQQKLEGFDLNSLQYR